MSGYSIEKQVCSLEQAKELAELLGDDAPESLWCLKKISDPVLGTSIWVLELTADQKGVAPFIPAYTGDELGVFLGNVVDYFLVIYCDVGHDHEFEARMYRHDQKGDAPSKRNAHEAHAKAALTIQGLREGWIKREDFRYV